MDIRKLNREQIKKLINSKNFGNILPTLSEADKKILKPYLNHKKPKITQTIKKAGQSLKEWVSHGLPTVSSEEYNRRLKICQSCEFWQTVNTPLVVGVCKLCNCTNAKLKLATEQCPNDPPYWKKQV
jgi:hypothetical protein